MAEDRDFELVGPEPIMSDSEVMEQLGLQPMPDRVGTLGVSNNEAGKRSASSRQIARAAADALKGGTRGKA